MIKVMMVGDVVGRAGMRVLTKNLRPLRSRLSLDFIVVNAENAEEGFGITKRICETLLENEVDVITSGNHVWDKKELVGYIDLQPRLLRPENYPSTTPGKGWLTTETPSGVKVGVLNLMGQAFMFPNLECPFSTVDRVLYAKQQEVDVVLVDFHAETTSEKTAMGWHLDGQVAAVVGTHTHVPTADERVLPGGTGYITDLGMTGCYNSVIGMDKDVALKRFRTRLPERLVPANGSATVSGVVMDIDESTGQCKGIKRLKVNE